MAGPPSPVAEIRLAVRRGLSGLRSGELVLVACSGGPDSLALASALAFEAPRCGLRAGLLTVDHGLQESSADRAASVADWGRGVGFDPSEVLTVEVGRHGGPEGAARAARYAALDAASQRLGAAMVMLGHTRDDQAETVLLAMARGAGSRALAGMAAHRGIYRRPLLDVARETTTAACVAEGLAPWTDPHNTDPQFARSRLRMLLPELEKAVGPGAVAGLARTANRVRDDLEVIDGIVAVALDEVRSGDGSLDATLLAPRPRAIRSRVLHRFVLDLGVPAGALASVHIEALDALVTRWSGQGPVYLPGGVTVTRLQARLCGGR